MLLPFRSLELLLPCLSIFCLELGRLRLLPFACRPLPDSLDEGLLRLLLEFGLSVPLLRSLLLPRDLTFLEGLLLLPFFLRLPPLDRVFRFFLPPICSSGKFARLTSNRFSANICRLRNLSSISSIFSFHSFSTVRTFCWHPFS